MSKWNLVWRQTRPGAKGTQDTKASSQDRCAVLVCLQPLQYMSASMYITLQHSWPVSKTSTGLNFRGDAWVSVAVTAICLTVQ